MAHNVSNKTRKADSALTISIGLVSLHYGIGFILGTGEQVYLYGASGAVYALSASLGLLGLGFLARFYWQEKYAIWNLLGDRYGENVRTLANFLSWIWMIGVLAGQMIGAGYALSVFGIPAPIAIICIGLTVAILGPLPLGRVAWVFAILLLVSTVALIVSLSKLGGLLFYWEVIKEFFPSLFSSSPIRTLGIIVTTFLLTLIGMDFQQVLVSAESDAAAVKGSINAGLFLIPVAFLPTAVVLGALKNSVILSGLINGKDAIPSVLWQVGNTFFLGGGIVMVIALISVAINSGSGLNRALIQNFQTSSLVPKFLGRPNMASWVNVFIAGSIALTGLTIVSIMVSFYAIYVAGVFIPFMFYLMEKRGWLRLSTLTIQRALWVGSITAVIIFLLSLIGRKFDLFLLTWLTETPEMWMTLVGMAFSAFTIIKTLAFGSSSRG